MPATARAARLAALALMLTAVTCAIPTDRSDEVFVTVELTNPVVLRGAQIEAYARLWRRLGADSAEILNVQFDWGTDAPAIATVAAGGFGSASITGVNAGVVNIDARAVAFDQAEVADVPVRVSNPLEIDDISPDTVRFGGKVTIAGVGIRQIFIATLGTGTLIADTLSHRGDPFGLDTMEFWVPPPSRTSDLFVLGPGVFFTAPETTVVQPIDIYEPNDIVARSLSLDDPGPFTQLPFVRFFNPALFFEPPPRDSAFGVDWYRFTRTDTAQALTLVMVSSLVGDTGAISTFLADSIYWDGPGGGHFVADPGWLIGPSQYQCRSWFWGPEQAAADSIVVAFRDLEDRNFDLITFYERPGVYALFVLDGYHSVLPPDKYEENDICQLADAKWNALPTRITLAPGQTFGDSLTIDNPFEIDWIRFRLTGGGGLPHTVTLKVAPRGAVAGAAETDIDVGLVGIDGTFYGYSNLIGSSDSIITPLSDGDYYAVVTDYLGRPLRYSICIASNVGCTPPAAAPSTGPALPKPVPAPRVGSASDLRRRLSGPR